MIMQNLARILALFGVLLLVTAGIIYLIGLIDLPLGKLPGDITIERKNFTIRIPVLSSLIISVLITIVLNILIRIFR
jgi:hypothetical protein